MVGGQADEGAGYQQPGQRGRQGGSKGTGHKEDRGRHQHIATPETIGKRACEEGACGQAQHQTAGKRTLLKGAKAPVLGDQHEGRCGYGKIEAGEKATGGCQGGHGVVHEAAVAHAGGPSLCLFLDVQQALASVLGKDGAEQKKPADGEAGIEHEEDSARQFVRQEQGDRCRQGIEEPVRGGYQTDGETADMDRTDLCCRDPGYRPKTDREGCNKEKGADGSQDRAGGILYRE